MDTKKVKELLKTANKLVMSKKYEETLEICKQVLVLDGKNYMAMVFIGASYEGCSNFTDSFKFYRQAIELDANGNLAWQGMGKLFDKADDSLRNSNADFFLQVFEKLREQYHNDDDKRLTNDVRLCKLYIHLGRFDSYLQLVAGSNPLHQEKFFNILFQHQSEIPIPEESDLLNLIIKAAKQVLNCPEEKVETRELAWKTYLKCLIKIGSDSDELWRILNAESISTKTKFSRDLLLRIFVDRYPEISDYSKIAGCLEFEEGALKCTYEGLKLFNEGDVRAARKKFEEAMEKDKALISAHRFQAKCLHKLHCFKESLSVINKGLKLLESSIFYGKSHQLKQEFNLMIVKNATHLNDTSILEEANKIIKQMDSEMQDRELNFLTLKIFLTLKMNNQEEINDLKREIQMMLEDASLTHDDLFELHLCLGMIFLKTKSYQESRAHLERACELKDDARGHFNLGLLLWDLINDEAEQDFEDADNEKKRILFINCMKQAILKDPYNPLPYYFIGCYFSQTSSSIEKTKQFFIKAFELDENDNQLISSALIDYLLKIDDQENVGLYLNVILKRMKSDCPKWVLLRLGAYYLRRGDTEDAIVKLQSAVAKDKSDLNCWERLGEAYLERGSYTTALKAFTRVLQTNPNSIYSLYQTACIQQKLGLFNEAIEKLERVIEIEPNYIPALYRNGNICLELAQSHISKCIFSRAVLSLQSSINSAARACFLNRVTACLWKTLGDTLTAFSAIPDSYISSVILPEFLKLDELISPSSSISKLHLLKLGERCYSLSLKLQPQDGNLWHDLGLNYYHQVGAQIRDVRSFSEKSSLNALVRKAFQCLHKASSLAPTDHGFWNALGIVAASKPLNDYALAQHCFIKSIQLDANNVTAWANLGFVYVINKEFMLAHEAFQNAQSIDPLFVPSWIGQALVAEELMKTGNVGRFEAMDLFRHSVESGNSPEAFISYSHWIYSTLDEYLKLSKDHGNSLDSKKWLEFTFKHLNAVDSALDAMAKYTAIRPTCIRGWNYFGLLCERQRLFRTAAEAFGRCLELLNEEDRDHVTHKKVVLTNYSRLLCKMGDYESSGKHYDDLFDLLWSNFEDDVSLPEICLMALCHFKSKNFEKSFKFYEIAFKVHGPENPDDDDDDDQLLNKVNLAMGICQFFMGFPQEAKHFILMGVGHPKGTLNEVLCSLLCLGLLQKEIPLTNIVLNEMHSADGKSVSCRSPRLAFLSSKAKLFLNNSLDARSALKDFIRAIHLNPNQSECWVRAAMFLLTNYTDSDITEMTKSLCLAALAKDDKTCFQEALQCAAIISIREFPWNDIYKGTKKHMMPSFSIAQKLVRLFPDQLTNWCILLASCLQQLVASQLGDDESKELMNFILVTARRVMAEVESLSTYDHENPYLKGMHKWLARQCAIALINAGQREEAGSFLENVIWLYEDDTLLSCLKSFLDGDVDQLLWSDDVEENASKLLAALIVSGRMRNKRELYENNIERTRWINENQKLKTMIQSCLQ